MITNRTTKTSFRNQCLDAAEAISVGVNFYQAFPQESTHFEDDGCLHVRHKTGYRACFDVGSCQSLAAFAQNQNTNKILTALGLEVTSDCLVEEEDELEDRCPTCGRSTK